MKAVAIVSGGLDSSVLAYWMLNKPRSGFEVLTLHMISFDYGQRHAGRELERAEQLAFELKARWTLIDLQKAGVTKLMQGSALTDSDIAVPDGHYAEESMKATIVPNRNSVMLAIAIAAAVADRASVVGIAVHAGDHAIYPDCRPEFIEAFERAEQLGNAWADPTVEVTAPFLYNSKAEIVKMGAALGVPFAETWSCYKGGEIHCGSCGTCVERREAFVLAGVPDPTEYAALPEFATPPVGWRRP